MNHLDPLPTGTIYTVESVWSFVGNELSPQRGSAFDIKIDAADVLLAINDYRRPLTVSGLAPEEAVVFLGILDGGSEETIGYFVTKYYNEDGAAIITPGDLLEESPGTWLSPKVKQRLKRIGRETLEEFSLQTLASYVFSK